MIDGRKIFENYKVVHNRGIRYPSDWLDSPDNRRLFKPSLGHIIKHKVKDVLNGKTGNIGSKVLFVDNLISPDLVHILKEESGKYEQDDAYFYDLRNMGYFKSDPASSFHYLRIFTSFTGTTFENEAEGRALHVLMSRKEYNSFPISEFRKNEDLLYVLDGHEEMLRVIKFDDHDYRIASGH